MSTLLQRKTHNLLAELEPVLNEFIQAAAESKGDFHAVERAGDNVFRKARTLIMSAGLTVSSQCADHDFRCPDCAAPLHIWERRERTVQTCEGEAHYRAVRSRCPRCLTFHAPLEQANGLANSQFTTMAQALVGSYAAQMPYAPAAAALAERGMNISAKEVDRMARDVAAWRKGEQDAVVSAAFGQTDPERSDEACTLPPLFDWSDWRGVSAMLASVDGAHVRSPERGPDGLEWFEARGAILSAVGREARGKRVYLGGVFSADALFANLSAAWQQSPHKNLPLVFAADGATWIWDRVRMFFPNCIEVLDIYHAGEHLASAAAALWGEGSEQYKQWKRSARDRLLAPGGVRAVLHTLLHGLRSGRPYDAAALRTEFAYLWRHRRRMRYHWLQQRGLPIGSGAMESAIKQTVTARLRGAGMKWTRDGADAILTLRAAHQSGEIPSTALRQHRQRMQVISRYRPAVSQRAA